MTRNSAQDILKTHQLHKSFNQTPAVIDVSLTLSEGQILCLLGPSGCGKTTLLRLIAGLETPDAGAVWFKGQDMAGVAPHQRGFGLMFQEFALFPHKNVFENVAFGLQMQRQTQVEARVGEMLDLVGLSGFETRDVSNLSGGERQRVALARSLAPRPRLLMLDEPLGALDRALRERLMLEIRQILRAVGLTAIYVTHDQTEAYAVADRIIVMNQGRIEQDAPPEQLYQQPATPFVAEFLGFTNLLPATCLPDNRVQTSLGIWPAKTGRSLPGDEVVVLVRPEAALMEPFEGGIPVEGRLETRLFKGRFYQITVTVSQQPFIFELGLAQPPEIGSQVKLWLNPDFILCLPPVKNG